MTCCDLSISGMLNTLNNGYLRQNQQFRAALEREAAILAARKCTPLDAAELWVILARLDAAEDEKIRGELERELHKKIAKIADNPMVYSVLAAAGQLTESIVSGTRDYIMKKNNSAREVDDQHHRCFAYRNHIQNQNKYRNSYGSNQCHFIQACSTDDSDTDRPE